MAEMPPIGYAQSLRSGSITNTLSCYHQKKTVLEVITLRKGDVRVMAKCLVCGNEIGNESTCQVCGTSTKFPVFFNREEYEQWIQEYLTPQREVWNKKKKVQPVTALTKGTLNPDRFHCLTAPAKDSIREIRILNRFDLDPAQSTDLSIEQDQSVLGLATRNVVYLAGDGDIRLAANCRALLKDFSTLERIVGAEFLDTSSVTDMGWMLAGCSALTTLDVSSWDTSNVTDMNGMFQYCSALSALNVSGWDTSNVTDMSSIFQNCSSLTTLDVSQWDTSQVSDMRWMFGGCYELKTLDVSSWDTSNVTDMGWMFGVSPSLVSLDVSRWDTSAVTDMRCMFNHCTSLRMLNASNWNTRNVNRHENMFDGVNLRQNPGIRPPCFSS